MQKKLAKFGKKHLDLHKDAHGLMKDSKKKPMPKKK